MSEFILVDSNVIIDVIEDDPNWADWSTRQLDNLCQSNTLIINPIIYAEISIAFARIEEFEAAIVQAGLQLKELPKEALFLAGKVFIDYRRRSKLTKHSTLPDFFIGAHAAVSGIPLLTRDKGRIETYFPTVKLITPTQN